MVTLYCPAWWHGRCNCYAASNQMAFFNQCASGVWSEIDLTFAPQARAANLTLLAAFPRAGASPAAQCGGACQGSGAMGAADASACGHMYLDDGEHIQGPKPSFLRDTKASDPRKPCPWHTT